MLIMSKLSIIIPIYNEKNTLLEIISRVEKTDIGKIKKEIILVDDCSTDNGQELLKGLEDKYKVFYHQKNQGKGAALRTGFKHATGNILVIQDADLEYDPQDYPKLIEVLTKGEADIVYGSRNLTKNPCFNKLYYFGSLFLNFVNNIFYGSHLTDIYTCYKMFKKSVLEDLPSKSRGFEFEAEITAKALKRGYKIKEVAISYRPRSIKEGKKINWKDALKGFWTIIKYRFKN